MTAFNSREEPDRTTDHNWQQPMRFFRDKKLKTLAALAVFAVSVAAAPVSAPAQTNIAPLDPAGCSDGTWVEDPENRPGVVEDCETLVTIRNHFTSNPANAHIFRFAGRRWPNPFSPVDKGGMVRLGSDDRVSSFHISNIGEELKGPIPAELGNLTDLEVLDLANTLLTGPIPAELGNLTNLKVLDLGEEILHAGPDKYRYRPVRRGEIPAELGNLTNLEVLVLHGNQLTGEIPAELGNLTNLKQLSLDGNQLTGEIPAELGNLTNLGPISYNYGIYFDYYGGLHLNSNQLTGEIPAELGNLTKLEDLFLYENQLTGEIPAELANLTKLEDLLLYENQLTGEIPAELGHLPKLERLDLSGNQLTSIPAELGDLTLTKWLDPPGLGRLDLSGNQLTSIPAELANLPNLRNLDLSGNQLTSIPTELANLPNLQSLDLSGNQLTSIPAELANLPNLQSLDLSGNQLASIPTWLANLTNLEWLYLPDSKLASIPAWLANFTNLSRLGISGSQLTSIPAWLGDLTNLEWLDLSRNQLTSIPTWLANLPLGNLDLSGNQLTSIPAELANLTELWRLYLSDNQLTGEIPAWLANLPLRDLDLSGNQFTGEIPAELATNRTWLRRLYLSDNQLTGEIPASLRVSHSFKFCPNRLTGALPPQLRSVSVDFAGNPDDIASYCRLAVTTSFEGRFSDDEGSVHEDSIEQIARWGITTGCEENRFCPSRTVNRAQMAAFLYRAVTHLHGGTAPGQGVGARLSDVASDAWYRTNALWAVNNGVIRAPGGRFDPGGAVTRADMAEMLIAAFDHLTAPAQARGLFTDTTGHPDAVVRAMEGIRAADVTTGCATEPLRYCPAQTVTRAQMASFLSRAVQALG